MNLLPDRVIKRQRNVALAPVNRELVDVGLGEKVLLVLEGPVEQEADVQALQVDHDCLLLVDAATLVAAELQGSVFDEATFGG